jgi:hypothetical protein
MSLVEKLYRKEDEFEVANYDVEKKATKFVSRHISEARVWHIKPSSLQQQQQDREASHLLNIQTSMPEKQSKHI